MKSALLAPLLIAAGLGGALGYKMGQTAAPQVSGERLPVEKEYSEVVSKLKTLNDQDFAEYMKLKNQKDMLAKANDIMAKMMQLFLYDLATRMEMTEAQINERKEFITRDLNKSNPRKRERSNAEVKAVAAAPTTATAPTLTPETSSTAETSAPEIPAPTRDFKTKYAVHFVVAQSEYFNSLRSRTNRTGGVILPNFASQLAWLQNSGRAEVFNTSNADLTERRNFIGNASYMLNKMNLNLRRRSNGLAYSIATEDAEKRRGNQVGVATPGKDRAAVLNTGLMVKIKDIDYQILIFVNAL